MEFRTERKMEHKDLIAEFEQDGFEVKAYTMYDQDSTPESLIEDEGPEYAEENQKRIDAWKRDEWHYVGVFAEAWKCGVKLATSAGLWGIEDDSEKSYFAEVSEDEASDAIEQAKAKLAELIAAN
jgi:hypothetical protein